MQLLKKTKNKKPFLFIIAGLSIVAGITYLLVAQPFSQKDSVTIIQDRAANDVDYNAPSQTEQQAAQQQKEDIIKQNETPTQQPTDNPEILVSIVRADQASAGQPLNIRADISGVSGGECVVTLTKSGQPTIQKIFSVIFEATSSRCQAADVPVSDFSVDGQWQLTLVVKGGNGQSKPEERMVEVVK